MTGKSQTTRSCAYLTMDNAEGWQIDADLGFIPLAALGWQVIAVPWRSSDTDWDQFDVVFGKFNVDRIIVKPVVSTNATDAFLLERENLADLEQTLSKVFPGWPFVA